MAATASVGEATLEPAWCRWGSGRIPPLRHI